MISSKNQTKEWRKKQEWYINGKHNECEKQQKKCIAQLTQQYIQPTFFRLNMKTLALRNVPNPMTLEDGFDWTETFDGIQGHNGYFFLYNLKMICDRGGSQTRSLREVYHFIDIQSRCLSLNPDVKIIFVNILDGDESYRNRDKFDFIVRDKRIFIGDMHEFSVWFYNFIHSSINTR